MHCSVYPFIAMHTYLLPCIVFLPMNYRVLPCVSAFSEFVQLLKTFRNLYAGARAIAKRASDVMTQTNKPKWRTIFLKHFLKQPVFLKHILKRKLCLGSLYFSQIALMLYELRRDIIVCILFLGLERFAIRYFFFNGAISGARALFNSNKLKNSAFTK